MNKEEAIRILNPKTYAEAIAKYEYYGGFAGEQAKALAVMSACELAVSALRSSHPSAMLDKKQWEKCEYCAEHVSVLDCQMLSHDDGDSYRGVYIYNGSLISNSGELQERKINFCPMCGRPLTGEA